MTKRLLSVLLSSVPLLFNEYWWLHAFYPFFYLLYHYSSMSIDDYTPSIRSSISSVPLLFNEYWWLHAFYPFFYLFSTTTLQWVFSLIYYSNFVLKNIDQLFLFVYSNFKVRLLPWIRFILALILDKKIGFNSCCVFIEKRVSLIYWNFQ